MTSPVPRTAPAGSKGQRRPRALICPLGSSVSQLSASRADKYQMEQTSAWEGSAFSVPPRIRKRSSRMWQC
jgi:hypothetical protein